MKERKILIIDDDPELLKLLKKGLERRNFSLITAQNGPEGLRLLYEHKPSLVILDIMMPKMDGWEVCRRIREMTNAPIIILTAKAREEDIIYGLDLGADDYVTKPFSISELVARIEAILRRMEETNPYGWGELSSYTVGDLEINFARRKVKVKGKDVDLTPTEFRLLAHLVRNAGKVIPHRTLLSQVWGPAYKEETDYLKLYVHYLRQKIEEDPRNPCYIITEWGVGYYFNGEG